MEKAPDLIVMTDMTYHNIGKLDNTLVKPAWKLDAKDETGRLSLLRRQRSLGFGSHRINGIFIMKGKDIKENATIENAEIIDIAPTILYLMGLPIPPDMDGKVLDVCDKI